MPFTRSLVIKCTLEGKVSKVPSKVMDRVLVAS